MTERETTVQEIRRVLQGRASPRMDMLTLVSITAAVGFASSFLILELGVTRMVVRYPLAVAIGYLAFLGFVRLWLRYFRLPERARIKFGRDGSPLYDVDLPVDAMSRGPVEISPAEFSGGGGFSGGGASGAWGDAGVSSRNAPSPARSGAIGRGDAIRTSGGGGSGWDFDSDIGLPLIVAAIVAAIALSILLYVVYIAPTLFAELLLDAGLAAGLYRRLSTVDRRAWLATAVRRTIVPAAAVATLLAVSGLIMQSAYPNAVSIGRVVDEVQAARANKHLKP